MVIANNLVLSERTVGPGGWASGVGSSDRSAAAASADDRGRKLARVIKIRGLEGGALCKGRVPPFFMDETIQQLGKALAKEIKCLFRLGNIACQEGSELVSVECGQNTVPWRRPGSLGNRLVWGGKKGVLPGEDAEFTHAPLQSG